MKRLEKWLREIAEKVDSESRLPPSGIIQMSPVMLHHLTKEIEQPFRFILVPAHSFMAKVKTDLRLPHLNIASYNTSVLISIPRFSKIGSKIY